MPAQKKLTRDRIIDAAEKVLRRDGYQAINARSVAKELGCSTQPIYVEFENMEQLKEILKEKAAEVHKQYVKQYMDSGEYNIVYENYGLGLVRFARDEKQLFRYLYLDEPEKGKHVDDVNLLEIISNIVEHYGYTQEVAYKFHKDLSFYTYGIAVMVSTGYLDMTDQEIHERLHQQFMALCSIYGAPPKMINKTSSVMQMSVFCKQ